VRKVVTPKDDEAPWLLVNCAMLLPYESITKHILMALADAWEELPPSWRHELRKAVDLLYP
jgi:hypothetical protein